LSSVPGPYGQVDVNLTDSTHASITFTAFNGFAFMDGGSAAVNVNATSWSTNTPSMTPPSDHNPSYFTGGTLGSVGSTNVDGWGIFNQVFDLTPNGFKGAAAVLSFNLVNTSGTWADDLSVLTPNAGGYLVGAHIAAYDPSVPANVDPSASVT